jgi:hypothetical protein
MSNGVGPWPAGAAAGLSRRRLARAALAFLALSVLPPRSASAQVGHEPERSPFRDVTTRQLVSLSTGWFFGNTSETGAGALPGPMFTFRVETRLSGPIDLLATASLIRSRRDVLNPDQPPATRRAGRVPYNLVSVDLGLGLNVTGAKSWHGLAPYAAAGVGVMFPTHPVVDPGGYQAKSNFTFAPTLGVRYLMGSSLGLQLEARDNTIRYEWPLAYFVPTDASGNTLNITPILDRNTHDAKDMTHNLSLSVSVLYRFNF